MPSSNFGHLTAVLSVIVQLNPKSIIEIGPGFDKNGFLTRELPQFLWEPGLSKSIFRFVPGKSPVISMIKFSGRFLDSILRASSSLPYVGSSMNRISKTSVSL